MKRNIDKMNETLLAIENSPGVWMKFDKRDNNETVNALYLCRDKGYVETKVIERPEGDALIARITWDGYHYLENLKEDIRRDMVVKGVNVS